MFLCVCFVLFCLIDPPRWEKQQEFTHNIRKTLYITNHKNRTHLFLLHLFNVPKQKNTAEKQKKSEERYDICDVAKVVKQVENHV